MTLFIDASAIIAILAGEDGWRTIERELTTHVVIWSAMSAWEANAGMCRSYRLQPQEARERIEALSREMGFRLVSIGEREAELALDAYARYGKNRHSAALNMGDCFAYACAKANDARLLYKGNDFAQTDLA
ncbi:type II toxin-antitoxin system VapC family toxin [Sphingomonas oligophenolica]|uniref:Type II toxin-antitoxin system VapC family toxin n=1 Tax=Sphingomonas oligophenolica TaxID=301154 RepID=A0ABU9Y9U7_9SPHN